MDPFYALMIFMSSLWALLIFADRLVAASVRAAKSLCISKTVIGLTILAYGSSLPELTVSVLAAEEASTALSVGNIVGSNIFNVLGILGIIAVLGHLDVNIKDHAITRDTRLMVGVGALFASLLYLNGGLGTLTGAILSSMLVVYTIYVVREGSKKCERMEKDYTISLPKELGIMLVCLVGLILSGHFTVLTAVNMAELLGVSEWVIGATIVAAGTSIPELMISLVAARRKEYGIALGNIVGSNIFNILWVMGLASWISPLSIPFNAIRIDLAFLGLSSLVLLFYISRERFTRLDGIAMLALYAIYIRYLLA